MTLNVAIIGAGQVAARHAEAYNAHPRARVVAVADPLPERAQALAERCDAHAYASYEELFDREALDAVSVCVPHGLHLAVTRAAIPTGAQLLMEKPIANTLEEADEMLRLVEEAGVLMMICFVHRFRNEVIEAKHLLDDGAIGVPATALDKFCSLGGPHPPAWTQRRADAGGGVLMYGGIHAVDRLLWLLGTGVVSVDARTHQYTEWATEVEDGMVALLTLENGVTAAMFENSPPYGRPGGWETELFGNQGALRIHNGEWCNLTSRTRNLTVNSHDELQFHRMIAEFIAAIEEDRECSVPGSVGRSTLEVASAIYASAALGGPVTLPLAKVPA